MEIREVLMDALKSYDNNRERSQQTEIGVSQLGGCRTQVWLQHNKALGGNPTYRLPSLMGTAIHTLIESALSAYSFGDYKLETAVEFEGLPGHIDWYIPETGSVVDWKTTKLKNLDYFPSTQQRWQVHTYGYLLAQNGHEVKNVTLVAIPRDGTAPFATGTGLPSTFARRPTTSRRRCARSTTGCPPSIGVNWGFGK